MNSVEKKIALINNDHEKRHSFSLFLWNYLLKEYTISTMSLRVQSKTMPWYNKILIQSPSLGDTVRCSFRISAYYTLWKYTVQRLSVALFDGLKSSSTHHLPESQNKCKLSCGTCCAVSSIDPTHNFCPVKAYVVLTILSYFCLFWLCEFLWWRVEASEEFVCFFNQINLVVYPQTLSKLCGWS